MSESAEYGWESKLAMYLGYILEILLIAVYLVGGFSFLQAAPTETRVYWGYLAIGIFLIMQAVFGRYSVLQVFEDIFHR